MPGLQGACAIGRTLLLAGGLLLALGGCASLKNALTPTPGTASAPASANGVTQTTDAASSEPPSAPPAANLAFTFAVEGPRELLPLLRNNLDLARLARDTTADNLSDLEVRRVEAATPAQARALLETEGYFQAKVTVQRNDATPPEVKVTVLPGPRAEVSNIRFEVQGELERLVAAGDADGTKTLAALREMWPLPEGAAFRNARWADGKSSLLSKLRAEGYAAATWSGTTAQVNAPDNSVRLTMILDSGPRYRLGEVSIEGMSRQNEKTVRNLAGFLTGAPATEATLLDYQDRLVRTGLYERISVTLDTDNADPAGTRVLVRITEAPLQQATLGLGISANTGPRISVEHTHRRVFGQRATARNKFEIGRLRQGWEGELSSHAQPDLHRNLVGGTYERLEADDNSDVVRSARARLGRVRETTAQEQYTFFQFERSDRTTATTKEGITAASINHHAIWRNVDNVLLPTKGFSVSLQSGLGYARGDAGRGPYGRLLGRIGVWQPLGGNWFGSGRLELGQVLVRDALPVPQTQLFRAGGDDSVRGYAFRSLGPLTNGTVAGGRVLFTSSVEVARPIAERLPSVWWAVFADAGQAANEWRDLKPVWGAGVGIRWRSPVGPLSVDWAWGNATRRARLHLSVGIVF